MKLQADKSLISTQSVVIFLTSSPKYMLLVIIRSVSEKRIEVLLMSIHYVFSWRNKKFANPFYNSKMPNSVILIQNCRCAELLFYIFHNIEFSFTHSLFGGMPTL